MIEIDALDRGYAPILEAVSAWAKVQDSVRAMFVSGSVANGTADAFSDLDLVIIVPGSEIEPMMAEVRPVLNSVEPLVLEHILAPTEAIRIFSVTTESWRRIDLAFGDSDSGLLRQKLVPVFDPQGLWDGTVPETQPPPITADEVVALAKEFLRVLGLSVVVNGRGDVHAAHDGANLLRNMLIELFLMEPPRRTRPGPKQLLPALSDEQQAALRALPPVADDLEILTTFSGALAATFLPRVRALIRSLDGPWPADLEEATRRYLGGSIDF